MLYTTPVPWPLGIFFPFATMFSKPSTPFGKTLNGIGIALQILIHLVALLYALKYLYMDGTKYFAHGVRKIINLITAIVAPWINLLYHITYNVFAEVFGNCNVDIKNYIGYGQ